MLLNLHLLRAIAALAVVYFHTTSEAGLNLPVSVGAHGVDVFFVISGFIVSYIGSRNPDHFLIRRVIRIVPFYWTATLVLFCTAAIAPHLLRSTQADPLQLLASLFFIPRETADGGLLPTLILGWSLNYEMYFYVMFALALAIAPRRAPLVCGGGIIAVACLLDVSGVTQPSLRFYARPLVFEFVFGIAAYYAYLAAERQARWFTERLNLCWLLATIGLVAAFAIGWEESHGGFGLARFLVAGVPAFALVLAALLLERLYHTKVTSNVVFLLGESSYVLYLIHPYVIYGVLRTTGWHRAHLTWPATTAIVIGLLLASTLCAIATHLWFEKPLIAALRRRLLQPASDRAVHRSSTGHASRKLMAPADL